MTDENRYSLDDITRQESTRMDRTDTREEYKFPLGKDVLEITYISFTYPQPEDNDEDCVDERLILQMKEENDSLEFYDSIWRKKDEISTNSCHPLDIGYSVFLETFLKRFPQETKDFVFSQLSSEARDLFEKGIKFYEDFQAKLKTDSKE